MLSRRHAIAALSMPALLPGTSRANAWPSRPVRLIVPFAPGGSVDAGARLLAEPLGQRLGQSVVVENRAGGGGIVGAEAAVRAPADGHTLLWGSSAVVSIAAALRRNISYSPLTDLAPVSLVMRAWHALLGSPTLDARTLPEAIAHARRQPGVFNIASGGTGSATHLLAERLKLAAGIDLVHVPYRGSGQIYPDLASGRVHFAFESLPVALAQVRAGTARLLGVTAPERTPFAPEAPTLVENGVTGFVTSAWFGVLVSSGTPAEIRPAIEAAVISASADADFRSRSANAGFEVVASSAAEFATLIQSEVTAWTEVGERTGIRLD
jgi:tripartite-type tricarboxylate transporter receptor subunit TctC